MDHSFIMVNKNPLGGEEMVDGGEEKVISKTTAAESPSLEGHPSMSPEYKPGSIPESSAHSWTGLSTHGRYFVDEYGRVCLPRGVNMSGSSKMPANHDPSIFPKGHEGVTFVGRPFPLEDALEHFARLRRWGLTFVRFLVTWEALEHAGIGQYDESYLTYLHALLSLLPKYSLTAFVSFHQDVFSRYSGGSGAPAWTLEAVGFDLDLLEETGAAYLGGVRVPGEEKERGRWPTGYQKVAASTMATVFWAGDIFAPKLEIALPDGSEKGVQAYLQDAFLDCYAHLVEHLKDLEGIVGFEVMNEPHRGYISLPSLHAFDYFVELHLHDCPSALQSFTLASGHPTTIPHYTRSFPAPTRLTSHVLRNEQGKKVWREDGPTKGQCLWEMHGVWKWDEKEGKGVVMREAYFKRDENGKEVDWYTACWYPFLGKWAERVHAITGGRKLIFVEGIPNEYCPPSWAADRQPRNMVFAPHWYDLNALFNKSFGNFTVNAQGISRGMFLPKALYWGHKGARRNYTLQIRNIVQEAYKSLSGDLTGEKQAGKGRPVFIGECGVPIDLNDAEAFRTGDFTWQERMMDTLMCGLEKNLIGFTLWNFNPENNDIQGDFWNGENFSFFSSSKLGSPPTSHDQLDASLDNGARILQAVVRPYAAKVAGIPLACDYDMNTGVFRFNYLNPSNEEVESGLGLRSRETEIFMPSLLAHGRRLRIFQDGEFCQEHLWRYDESRQTLFILHEDTTEGKLHTLRISFDPPLERRFDDSSWMDYFSDTRWVGFLVPLVFMIFLGRLFYAPSRGGDYLVLL